MPRKKYQVEQLKQCPIAWQLLHFAMTKLFKQTHSWLSLHQTGDELKSLLIHLPSRECFPRWHQVWQSHGDEFHTLIPLSEQECEDCLTRRHLAGDTAVTKSLNVLNDIPTSLRICEKYWHFSWQDFKKQILPDKSVYSVKRSTLLQATKIQTSYSASAQLSDCTTKGQPEMFYCAYKLCMKYLNIQSASGQVSGSFNALFINE